MTREEIQAMVPGRGMDFLIAEKLYDADVSRLDKNWMKFGGLHTEPKQYSTNIAHAWEIVNLMNSLKQGLSMEYISKEEKWVGSFDEHRISEAVEANTAPELICKAALIFQIESEERDGQ